MYLQCKTIKPTKYTLVTKTPTVRGKAKTIVHEMNQTVTCKANLGVDQLTWRGEHRIATND